MMFIDGLQSWPIFDLCLRSAREHKLQDAPRFRCLNHCQMDLGKSSFLRMRTAWRSILETLTTSPAWSRTLAGCNNITIQSIPNCYSAQKTEMADFFPPRYRGFACCGKPRKEKNDLQFCSGASVWTFWNLLCGPVYLALGQFRPKGNALRSDENVVQFGAKLRDVSEFFSTMTLLDLLSQLSLGTGVSLQHLRCLDMFYQGTRCKHRPKTQGDGTFFVVNSVRKAWKYTKYWWSLLTFCRSLEDSFFRIS